MIFTLSFLLCRFKEEYKCVGSEVHVIDKENVSAP